MPASNPDADTLKAWQRTLQKEAARLRAAGAADAKQVKQQLTALKVKLRQEWKATNAPPASAAPARPKRTWEQVNAERRQGGDDHKPFRQGKRAQVPDADAEEDLSAVRAEKGRKHDLVIIPIINKRDAQETAALIQRATEIKASVIEAMHLNTWIDQRNSHTPGEKFAYWEFLDVKLRVELGPRELKKNTCVLVRNETPGVVGQREENLSTEQLIERLKELRK
jgi:hypothetical protein